MKETCGQKWEVARERVKKTVGDRLPWDKLFRYWTPDEQGSKWEWVEHRVRLFLREELEPEVGKLFRCRVSTVGEGAAAYSVIETITERLTG